MIGYEEESETIIDKIKGIAEFIIVIIRIAFDPVTRSLFKEKKWLKKYKTKEISKEEFIDGIRAYKYYFGD